MVWQFPYNPSGILTHYLPMYVGGACLGGILAGVFYNQHVKLFEKEEDEQYRDGVHSSGKLSHAD